MDLFQETLLQLWRSIPAWAGRCRESTWIYRVALNTAYGWCRSEKRRRTRQEHVVAFTVASEVVGASAADLSARSDLELLYSAIRGLARTDASLIVMHLDGLSSRDIGEVLGITENSAAVKFSRARKQLAQLVKEELK